MEEFQGQQRRQQKESEVGKKSKLEPTMESTDPDQYNLPGLLIVLNQNKYRTQRI